MPEIEIFEDKSVMIGKRRKGRDESIEDAFKTMERFSDWLIEAQEPTRNVWQECDAMNTAMLYGMLMHLRNQIDQMLAAGGDEARQIYEFFSRNKDENKT